MSYQVEIVDRPEQTAAVLRGHAAGADIGPFLTEAFGSVAALVGQQRLTYTGPPFARYTPTEDGSFDIEAGFPVAGPATSRGRVEIITLPGGPTARTLHVGPYETVGAAYEATAGWLQEHGYVAVGTPWEAYLDGPGTPNPRTEVCVPVRRR